MANESLRRRPRTPAEDLALALGCLAHGTTWLESIRTWGNAPLSRLLSLVAAAIEGDPLRARFEQAAKAVSDVSTVAAALESSGAVPAPDCAILSAGERISSSSLRTAAETLSAGYAHGWLPLHADPTLRKELQAAFVQLEAWVRTGAPLADVPAFAGAAGAALAEAAKSDSLAAALSTRPDLFAGSVVHLLRVHEEAGDLTRAFRAIAEGLDRGAFLPRG